VSETIKYWRPEPKRYGFAWWALLIPALVYSLGVIVYAHAAFVPGAVAENGHAIGSALMVVGGEAGTLAAASEVFRKSRIRTGERRRMVFLTWQTSEATVMDWLGLLVSLVATLGNLFVVYTALTGLAEPWVLTARNYGPLALLLCSGLDFYANVMEFGFFNASFDERWADWNDKRHSWEQSEQTRMTKTQSEPAAPHKHASAPQSAVSVRTERTAVARDPGDGAESAPHSDTAGDGHATDAVTCPYCGRNGLANAQALSAHLRWCEAYQALQAQEANA